MRGLKDAGHLFRFAGLFVIAFLVFWVIRGYVVPKSFGQYGHYRGAAIGDLAAHPAKFAGHEACETCHSDVADTHAKGAHAHVNCEACHGALYQRLSVPAQPKPNLYERFAALIVKPVPPDPPILLHADDPVSVIPVKPDTAVLCVRCHAASAAKPRNFPQIVVADHYPAPCESCHNPHSPAMGSGSGTSKAAGGAK
jgi:hypothetical protein